MVPLKKTSSHSLEKHNKINIFPEVSFLDEGTHVPKDSPQLPANRGLIKGKKNYFLTFNVLFDMLYLSISNAKTFSCSV